MNSSIFRLAMVWLLLASSVCYFETTAWAKDAVASNALAPKSFTRDSRANGQIRIRAKLRSAKGGIMILTHIKSTLNLDEEYNFINPHAHFSDSFEIIQTVFPDRGMSLGYRNFLVLEKKDKGKRSPHDLGGFSGLLKKHGKLASKRIQFGSYISEGDHDYCLIWYGDNVLFAPRRYTVDERTVFVDRKYDSPPMFLLTDPSVQVPQIAKAIEVGLDHIDVECWEIGKDAQKELESMLAEAPEDGLWMQPIEYTREQVKRDFWAREIDQESYWREKEKVDPKVIAVLEPLFEGKSQEEMAHVRLLDAGAGSGDLLALIKKRFPSLNVKNMRAVEWNGKLAKMVEESGFSVDQLDITKGLPYSDGEFDIVIAEGLLVGQVIPPNKIPFVMSELSRVTRGYSETKTAAVSKAGKPVSAALRQVASRGVSKAAVARLSSLGADALPSLISVLEEGGLPGKDGYVDRFSNPNRNVRRAIVQALGSIENSKATECLIRSLGDVSKDVMLDAIGALGKIGDTRAIDPLEKIFAIYQSAIEAKVTDEEGVDYYVEARRDNATYIAIASALSEIREKTVAERVHGQKTIVRNAPSAIDSQLLEAALENRRIPLAKIKDAKLLAFLTFLNKHGLQDIVVTGDAISNIFFGQSGEHVDISIKVATRGEERIQLHRTTAQAPDAAWIHAMGQLHGLEKALKVKRGSLSQGEQSARPVAFPGIAIKYVGPVHLETDEGRIATLKRFFVDTNTGEAFYSATAPSLLQLGVDTRGMIYGSTNALLAVKNGIVYLEGDGRNLTLESILKLLHLKYHYGLSVPSDDYALIQDTLKKYAQGKLRLQPEARVAAKGLMNDILSVAKNRIAASEELDNFGITSLLRTGERADAFDKGLNENAAVETQL